MEVVQLGAPPGVVVAQTNHWQIKRLKQCFKVGKRKNGKQTLTGDEIKD